MIKVTLREKKLKTERISLYLDYYPPIIDPKTGNSTRREFLELYIFKNPKNQEDKKHNAETLAFANGIRSKREVQIRNKEYGFRDNVNISVDFIGFYKRIVDDYYNKGSKSNYQAWIASLNHFSNFCNNLVMTSNLDIHFVNRYRSYLLNVNTTRNSAKPKKLTQNTSATYFKHFLYVLKKAYNENFIEKNLAEQADYIKEEETHREYLTEKELNLLWNTPIKSEKVKHMAMFSALTGLRYVAVNNLNWSSIFSDKHQNNYITLLDSKSKSIKNHPISEDAFSLLKAQPTREGLVFGSTEYYQVYRFVKEWIVKSDIKKKISFHNFRHSYATLQLANGTDIYTVSKLLGHKNLTTTQIYTKVLDKNKIEAANRIKLNLDGL